MDQGKNIQVETNGRSLPVKREQHLTLMASPVADIYETRESFVVSLDLPGADKESIQVVVEPGTLAVRAAVSQRHASEGKMIHREIGWNAYERTFKLGPGIEDTQITATYSDGVLTIILPKTETSKARQISIS